MVIPLVFVHECFMFEYVNYCQEPGFGNCPWFLKSFLNQKMKTANTTSAELFFPPTRIDVIEKGDSIEFVYKEVSKVVKATYPGSGPEERVFKVVFSCKNGSWHKSDRIYGEIHPAQNEQYSFND